MEPGIEKLLSIKIFFTANVLSVSFKIPVPYQDFATIETMKCLAST